MRVTLDVRLDLVQSSDSTSREFRNEVAAFKAHLREFLAVRNESFELVVLAVDQKVQD